MMWKFFFLFNNLRSQERERERERETETETETERQSQIHISQILLLGGNLSKPNILRPLKESSDVHRKEPL